MLHLLVTNFQGLEGFGRDRTSFPESRAWNRQNFSRRHAERKSNRSKVQSQKINSESPSESHPIGGVPTTPDPNTSAKVSRYKWEAYRDTNWWGLFTTFCQEEGDTFAEVSR